MFSVLLGTDNYLRHLWDYYLYSHGLFSGWSYFILHHLPFFTWLPDRPRIHANLRNKCFSCMSLGKTHAHTHALTHNFPVASTSLFVNSIQFNILSPSHISAFVIGYSQRWSDFILNKNSIGSHSHFIEEESGTHRGGYFIKIRWLAGRIRMKNQIYTISKPRPLPLKPAATFQEEWYYKWNS